jgi:hypothetical protein
MMIQGLDSMTFFQDFENVTIKNESRDIQRDNIKYIYEIDSSTSSIYSA